MSILSVTRHPAKSDEDNAFNDNRKITNDSFLSVHIQQKPLESISYIYRWTKSLFARRFSRQVRTLFYRVPEFSLLIVN